VATDLMEKGIVPLCGVRQALDAAQAAVQIGAAWDKSPDDMTLPGPGLHPQGPPQSLDEWQAKHELASAGISVPRGERVDSLAALEAVAKTLAFPLVLKACGSGLTHKSDTGAVITTINELDDLIAAAKTLFARHPQLLVEEMVTDAVCELIVGVGQDPVIGPWIMIGSGGVYAELMADRKVLLLPAQDDGFEQALDSLKMSPVLKGYRGGRSADISALLDALQKISDFSLEKRDSLIELEINPLLVCAEGKGVCAVDAVLQYARAS